MTKLMFLATEDWFFRSHFLPLARQAVSEGYEVAVAARDSGGRAGGAQPPGSWEAGQEPVDLGQEVPPGGIALRQQVVAAVKRNQPALRDQRGQQP